MKAILTQLHKAFESRVRLGIMSALAVNEMLDFTTLKSLLDVTDGNLASHLRALEREGFIAMEKSFIERKPNTRYGMTPGGKAAFEAHLEALEMLIRANNS